MVNRHITPVELTCPHCNVREKFYQTGDHVCFECHNKSVIDCDFKSGGVEIVYRHWWDGMSPRMSTTIHHVLDYDPMPHVTIKPRQKTEMREYKCLECGWHECSETDHFKCTQCGNWSHDDIRARFEALKDLPLPDQVRNRFRAECAKHGVDYDAESARINGEPPRPFVRPLESPALHAQRVGRVRRLPKGDMTEPGYDTALPGYDRKAARNKAVQRSELRWVGAAFVAVIVVARFVTAHDFGSFVGDMLTLGLGAAIGLTFFKPDKR